MDCRVVAENDIIERYFAGQLSDEESRAFEEHYFECNGCYAGVRDHLAVRGALTELQTQTARSGSWLQPWWLLAAAVLVLAMALSIWWSPRPGGVSIPNHLAELAAVEPPPYAAPQLRGSTDPEEKEFQTAMELYLEGRYAETATALEKLTTRSARSDFYLGACYLLAGEPELAIETLDRVVDSGNRRYLASAHFYRGKAFLSSGDADAAVRDFETVIGLGGEWVAEARSILDQLPR